MYIYLQHVIPTVVHINLLYFLMRLNPSDWFMRNSLLHADRRKRQIINITLQLSRFSAIFHVPHCISQTGSLWKSRQTLFIVFFFPGKLLLEQRVYPSGPETVQENLLKKSRKYWREWRDCYRLRLCERSPLHVRTIVPRRHSI